jgi:hypothetical protein
LLAGSSGNHHPCGEIDPPILGLFGFAVTSLPVIFYSRDSWYMFLYFWLAGDPAFALLMLT